MRSTSVTVIGAAGHTGRFVVTELRRRGLSPILAGRDAGKLTAVAVAGEPVHVMDVADPASLDAAVAGAGAVINCAGPFLDTGLAVIDAAIRAGIPYLDVTAEQASVQTAIAERSALAEEAGVLLLPAAAFYGGLADLLASLAADDLGGAEEIDVAVALDSWHPTEGTRVTGRRNTAPRLVVGGGELRVMDAPARTATRDFPTPFGTQDVVMLPFSETITLARHFSADRIESWINRRAIEDVRDAATPAPKASDASGRSPQIFAMQVAVSAGGKGRRVTATGRDIYAVSAPIIVEAAERLLAGAASGRGGVRTMGELFNARDFLAALGPDTLAVTVAEA